MVTGVFTGPRRARPTNAVIDVATPMIVRTPLGTSSTYTPGYVVWTGISPSFLSGAVEHLNRGAISARSFHSILHLPFVSASRQLKIRSIVIRPSPPVAACLSENGGFHDGNGNSDPAPGEVARSGDNARLAPPTPGREQTPSLKES
jgi:hypothetical protein